MHHRFIGRCTRKVQAGIRIASCVVCLAGCVLLASCKKGPDISTPRKAAVLFAKAAEAGDMETVHQVATGTDAEFALVKDWGQERQAMDHFVAAGAERFGDLGKYKDISLDLAAEFATSDEKINGDTATLTAKPTADNPEPAPVVLKKDGNKWKFDLSYLDKDDTAREQSQKMPLAAKAWDQGKEELQNGKYRSFPEALGTLRREVKHIILGAAAIKQDKEDDDKKKAFAGIITLATGLEKYKADAGAYPSTAEGLIALMKQPSGGSNWKGPYLEEAVPLDAWGHAYVYLAPGEHNSNGYDLHSIGPDGQDGTADDITNWNVTP